MKPYKVLIPVLSLALAGCGGNGNEAYNKHMAKASPTGNPVAKIEHSGYDAVTGKPIILHILHNSPSIDCTIDNETIPLTEPTGEFKGGKGRYSVLRLRGKTDLAITSLQADTLEIVVSPMGYDPRRAEEVSSDTLAIGITGPSYVTNEEVLAMTKDAVKGGAKEVWNYLTEKGGGAAKSLWNSTIGRILPEYATTDTSSAQGSIPGETPQGSIEDRLDNVRQRGGTSAENTTKPTPNMEEQLNQVRQRRRTR